MKPTHLANRAFERIAEKTSIGRTYLLMRHTRVAQPKKPVAKVVISAMTEGGANANGKVKADLFFPPFCDELRRNGFKIEWAWSKKELARRLAGNLPAFIIHLYGEDNVQILDEDIQQIEKMAVATFNRAETGPLLADKIASQKILSDAGVNVPPVTTNSGHVRRRLGSKKSTDLGGQVPANEKEENFIRTRFIDTRVNFNGKSYYTTIRLICVDEIVLHAYPRARDVDDGNPDVHAGNTPLDADLIEYLHTTLVTPFEEEFRSIAQKLFSAWGHGFFAHDLLIEGRDVFVCESGFKIDDLNYSNHLGPISNKIPSQAPLFPIEEFSRKSAEAFVTKCASILQDKH
ncbi:hypothetical protein [uncultured Marivita sp.]|uniref:hypothetical protein n=1 Tax=uncultured Marivita sp. TaxID=888080 RepID=UPI002616B46A|nr:hypothetical protein [uncultured Marivita sp.]